MTTFTFNCWSEPWIRCQRLNGESALLSIEQVLTKAHELYSLIDDSPLVVGATNRLLIAILHFIHQPQELADVIELIERGAFDRKQLDPFAQHYATRFDIFDPALPFLQTSDVAINAHLPPAPVAKAKKSAATSLPIKTIAYLFPEIPSETNRALFKHVLNDDFYLCPACCTAGLAMYPAFAQNGGSGWRASINGDPPIYTFPIGQNLFESLSLSLINQHSHLPRQVSQSRAQVAPWTGDGLIEEKKEQHQIGYVESLLFPARRVRLFPITYHNHCSRCGEFTALAVREMYWKPGAYPIKASERWQDPFVGYYIGADKTYKSLHMSIGKAAWREYSTLFLNEPIDGVRQIPAVVDQYRELVNNSDFSQTIWFRCIGMKTDGKAKVLAWMDEALSVPARLLENPVGRQAVREALDQATICAKLLSTSFFQHLDQAQNSKRHRYQTIHDRMLERYWHELGQHFLAFVEQSAAVQEPEVHQKRWVETIRAVALQQLDYGLAQVGDRADCLRRSTEARNAFQAKYYVTLVNPRQGAKP
ncbi:type I-E CRISPR-associated protein Cse1/CasA [Herpetosiphon gulosus]|uniref:CRISPR-associated protein CasA/Cse1 n=1 Tax=Herpetosiphon gulosus TaxID=1973496 RepID=A0ABP9X709_9CHLR